MVRRIMTALLSAIRLGSRWQPLSTTIGVRAWCPKISRLGSSRTMRLSAGALLVLCATVGCRELSALADLQARLAAQFESPDVIVMATPGGSQLTVVFRNSRLPSEDRSRFALAVAEFVRDHYQEYAKLQLIDVSFDSVRMTNPLEV